MSAVPSRRTHVWGEAPLSWGARPLAVWLSEDGAQARTIHGDGAWVEWRLDTGEVERVVTRCGDAAVATFIARGEAALVAHAPRLTAMNEIEHIDRPSGSRRTLARTYLGTSSLLLAPDESAFAAVPLDFGGVRSLYPIDGGEALAVSRGRERWLAIGPDGRRVLVVEIQHPDGWQLLGYEGDGSPIEDIGPPSFVLRVTGPGGETLAEAPLTRSAYDATAVFVADGTRVFCAYDGAVTSFRLDAVCEQWRVALEARVVALAEARDTLYVKGRSDGAPFFAALSLTDGSTRWTSPIDADAISADESTAIARWGSSLVVQDVARGAARELPVALEAVRTLALSTDGNRVAVKLGGRVVVASTKDPRRQTLDGVAPNEVLVFGTDDHLWTGDGQRWRSDEAGRFVPAPPSDATWQPWCWSASGERILGQFGRRISGSLALYDRSGAFVAQLAAGSRDTVACFEGEELVLFRLGQIWRYSAILPLAFVHPPRLVEWGLASDNVIAALGPGRLLLIDRNTHPRPTPPDRTPEQRRLRVIDHTQAVPVVRVLRSWSHREAEGEPMIAMSADGRRALDGVVGRPEVRLWDLDAGTLSDTIDLTEEGDGATSLAMAEDGRVFVIGTARGRVLRFELDDDVSAASAPTTRRTP